MPELPEVETVRRGLATHLEGATITSVDGVGGRLVRHNPGGMADLKSALSGTQISGAQRRGKYMWLTFTDRDYALVIHLGMSGQVRVNVRAPKQLARHEHVRLSLEGGKRVRFIDPRTFGHLTVSPLQVDRLGRTIPAAAAKLAPDPLEDASAKTWTEPMRRTRRPIKTVLLDQSVISGIGNIYADEALFQVSINGREPGVSLSEATANSVVDAARAVMTAALAQGGTSFDSLYVDTEGNPGYFSRRLQVYQRAGRACPRCGDLIERTVIAGRSHFFCPTCQAPQSTR